MDFSVATAAAPGRENQDYFVLSARFAVVLDGVTEPPGIDSGCVHDPVWLVRVLGAELTAALSADAPGRLDQALAEAIERVRARHGSSCDLANPNSPSTTVAIVRERDAWIDYLVLCDSTVAFDRSGVLESITDDRTDTLPAYDRETVAALRNAPGGFWVASTDPAAAAEALTGTVPLAGLDRLLVCTDGVSRLVDYFGRSWPQVFALVGEHGPAATIAEVRRREREQPDRLVARGRRVKPHDDATLAWSVTAR